MPHHLSVVVPAHNEEELIGRCLDAIHASRARLVMAHPDVSVSVWVVLDSCTDGTTRVLERYASTVSSLSVSAGAVGAARRAGVEACIRQHGQPDTQWIASTDADSRVPPDWLAVHLNALQDGADLLLGTVRPDPADLTDTETDRWAHHHPPGSDRGNIYGANLGIRADSYVALGGFRPLPSDEDVDLVTRARAAGLRVATTDEGQVVTSGRRDGRAPHGYAAFLEQNL